ncbi:MAG: hypothetical protein PHH61_01895 [Candidatus Nanoarchaeia archaeon]|nr:hypothetical protein [Candidatus Paceibacterota bacterium]MDD5239193.1 hypothetical protein [Candidatus Nanoarchaeia archaeon]
MGLIFKNKKAQFGPDLLVGFLLIAILGLGGVFFLNTFVSSLSLNGLISIIDAETEQECVFMLLPMMKDEYIRAGYTPEQISSLSLNQYTLLRGYLDSSKYESVSSEFNSTINYFKDNLGNVNLQSVPVKILGIQGYIATPAAAKKIPNDFEATRLCSMPVYSPYGYYGIAGYAQLFVLTR